jgi:hypothetical protein
MKLIYTFVYFAKSSLIDFFFFVDVLDFDSLNYEPIDPLLLFYCILLYSYFQSCVELVTASEVNFRLP